MLTLGLKDCDCGSFTPPRIFDWISQQAGYDCPSPPLQSALERGAKAISTQNDYLLFHKLNIVDPTVYLLGLKFNFSKNYLTLNQQ